MLNERKEFFSLRSFDGYYARFNALEVQYIGAIYIPRRTRYEENVETDCRHYFDHRYNTGN